MHTDTIKQKMQDEAAARRELHGAVIIEALMKDRKGRAYRAILWPTGRGNSWNTERKPVLSIEQQIKGGWFGTPGSWYMETLTDHDGEAPEARDRIAIDHGAGWFVTGLNAVLAEATEHLRQLEWDR